jgi:hypothetical protein
MLDRSAAGRDGPFISDYVNRFGARRKTPVAARLVAIACPELRNLVVSRPKEEASHPP